MKSRLSTFLTIAALLAAPAVLAQQAQVDPYTGRALTLESLSRKLDTAKMETALLQEQVQEARLKRELTSLSRDPSAQSTARRVRQISARAHRSERGLGAPPAAPATAPQISAVSILNVGDARTALLKVGTRTLSVRNGQMTSFGKVLIPDDHRVILGTRTFTVR